jgi:hypothetical protein
MLRIEAFAAYPSGASLFPPMCSMDLQRFNRCSGACRGPYGAGPYNSRGRGPPTIICLCRGPYPTLLFIRRWRWRWRWLRPDCCHRLMARSGCIRSICRCAQLNKEIRSGALYRMKRDRSFMRRLPYNFRAAGQRDRIRSPYPGRGPARSIDRALQFSGVLGIEGAPLE